MNHNVKILLILQQINFWGMFLGLGLLFYLNVWYYYLITIAATIIIAKGGVSIAQHRYFSHHAFSTTPIKDKILLWLATLSGTGTILQYSAVHRYHHIASDSPTDLHSPETLGLWRSWFHWYRTEDRQSAGPIYIKDLLRRQDIRWHHDHYFSIIFFYILLLALIDPVLVIFCYMIPNGYAWLILGLTAVPVHINGAGYRNFNTPDQSSNNKLVNWITLGEGMHNNHHHRPQEYNNAFTKGPGEWDFCAWIIDNFLKHEDKKFDRV